MDHHLTKDPLHRGRSREMGQSLRYSCFGRSPGWLQRLNSIRWFVVWLCLAFCFQMMLGGSVGVVMSTIEKQFDFSSSESSWIASANEIGLVPVVVVVSYFGNRIHRPRSCAVGLLMSSVGCLFFFVPHFTFPSLHRSTEGVDGPPTDLCPSSNVSLPASKCIEGENQDTTSSYHLAIFIVGGLLCGMGSTSIVTLGVTYLDDCSTRRKFATYIGVFSAMSIVGPALAYLGGGFVLNIYVDFFSATKNEAGLTPSDARWIGAWWLPFTIAAVLCFITAIPFMGYPEDLPGAAEIRKEKLSEAHNGGMPTSNAAQLVFVKTWCDFQLLFRKVFTNPTYVCLTVFVCSIHCVTSGFTAFGPKTLEVKFTMTAAISGAVYGIVLLPAGVGGTVIGGLLIDKLNLTCTQIIRIQTVLCLFFLVCVCSLFLRCHSLPFAGIHSAYNTRVSSDLPFNLTDDCNVGCECHAVPYNPVCSHENVMYYSPCHAGCSLVEYDGEKRSYYNCSCITDHGNDSSPDASSLSCSADVCTSAILFLAIFFLAVLAIFMAVSMNMSATLRCVDRSQTSFAVGMQVLFSKFPGTTLGPIFFGMAFDRTCILWQHDECGARGNCLAYDNEALSLNLFLVCFIASLIALIAVTLAAMFYRSPVADEPSANALKQSNSEVEVLKPDYRNGEIVELKLEKNGIEIQEKDVKLNENQI